MPSPRILILVPGLQPNDAVGQDVLGMMDVYRDAGYDVAVFSESIHPSCQAFAMPVQGADAPWNDPRSIVIYHHATHWERGEQILRRAKGRVIIKYHNITPPHFFNHYSEEFREACARGAASTDRIARIPQVIIWGDSRYNCSDFIRRGVDPTRSHPVPPCHRIESLAREPLDAFVTGAFRACGPLLLFVGAFRPNKGQAKAVETFAEYLRRSRRPARLLLAGNLDPRLSHYVDDIRGVARRLEVLDFVHIATSVSPMQLRAFYTSADVFLCVSEHEGFCMPLVEAMAFRVPLVAWDTSAVGETMGGAGVAVEHYAPAALAEAIDELTQNPLRALSFAEHGRRRYEQVFHPGVIRRRLLQLLEGVAAL